MAITIIIESIIAILLSGSSVSFTRKQYLSSLRPEIWTGWYHLERYEGEYSMRYELCRVAQNSQVKKYFNWLDYWFKMVGEDEIKFGALRRYAARK